MRFGMRNNCAKLKTDSEIEQWVLREVSFDHTLASKELCILCCEGVVTLYGAVKDEREWRAVQSAAWNSPGVVRILNRIRIVPTPALVEAPLIVPAFRPAEYQLGYVGPPNR